MNNCLTQSYVTFNFSFSYKRQLEQRLAQSVQLELEQLERLLHLQILQQVECNWLDQVHPVQDIDHMELRDRGDDDDGRDGHDSRHRACRVYNRKALIHIKNNASVTPDVTGVNI